MSGAFPSTLETYTSIRPNCSSTHGYVQIVVEATVSRVHGTNVPSIESNNFAVTRQC
jgi:hypothetical protein